MKICIYLQPASYPKVYHFDLRCDGKDKRKYGKGVCLKARYLHIPR